MRTLLSIVAVLMFAAGLPLDAEAKGRGAGSSPHGKTKTFMTYKKSGPMGKVYVGRTSGSGTPQSILAKRENGHHMDAKGYDPARIDRTSSNSAAIRGREQQLIEKHKAEGRSGNAINGIGPKNPKREHYLSEAEKEFGKP